MNSNSTTAADRRQAHDVFNGIEAEISAAGLYALACWLDASQKPEMAMAYYRKAIEKDPEFAEAHYNLGVLYNALRDQPRAVEQMVQAMTLKPDLAQPYSLLGMIRCDQHRFEQALVYLEQAVAIDPNFTEAHFNMGLIFQQMGKYQNGLACFRKALVCNPAFAPARWMAQLSLPMIYDRQDQIESARKQFSENLDRLSAGINLETPSQIQYAFQGINTATNFYLQYQGRNDLELQSKYGRLVHAVMTARYPHWRKPPPMPSIPSGDKIRIGYVSSFMHDHTVGTFLSGWIENHDHGKFQIHGYHVGGKTDATTQHFKKICHRFHHIPGNVESAATRIAADRLHILVYTDIGMNTETLQLAALRLAPIQCKGWGHPVTTGLPTVDYYLSSELMEPDDADAYYSETLIRLPNLALCYGPAQLPKTPMDRKSLGIPTDRFVYLSPQSIFKYLPQHDEIYALIARQVPDACFVFIQNQSEFATDRFRQRLIAAFRRHDLEADTFCHFSPRMDFEGFLSLNLAADVLLDTFEWSGGKTSLEAIGCGLPVVTCPGRFMRGRHAYAMLRKMGIEDTIARDQSEYCRIAARLAKDQPFYERSCKKIVSRRDTLYNDQIFIRALENQYHAMAHGRYGAAATTSQLKSDGLMAQRIDSDRGKRCSHSL